MSEEMEHAEGEMWDLVRGDALEVLALLDDNSMDSWITDPPAGIGFMNKGWDSFGKTGRNKDAPLGTGPAERFGSSGIAARPAKGARDGFMAAMQAVAEEALRVLKPGAFGLVWTLPRTSHWTAMALEFAGFDVIDKIAHFFGQGFPKSQDVSRLIQKHLKVKPIGEKPPSLGMANNPQWNDLQRQLVMPEPEGVAARWRGWGIKLKPAREDWILVQKPFKGSIAKNVLEWGTGALNIDGCRIGTSKDVPSSPAKDRVGQLSKGDERGRKADTDGFNPNVGRFPAHITFDEEAAALLDEQTGDLKKGGRLNGKEPETGERVALGHLPQNERVWDGYGDSGGASRFFYVAKPSRKEKEAGCEGLTPKTAAELTGRKEGSAGLVMRHTDGSEKANPYAGTSGAQPRRNHHPTVKPVTLMRYYIRLITPPGGIVLDTFAGSGTTGVAAILEGMRFFGIDKDQDGDKRAGYFEVAQARLRHAEKEAARAE